MSDNKEQGFLNDYSSNKKLNEAVIEQMGGFESFSENAQDISNHGIDGGFSGFINYSETVEFSQNNRDVILQSLKDDAQEFGSESVPEMMSHWKALDGFSQDEIAEALYSNDDALDAHTPVYNALAWYAGEKASNEYANAIDELESQYSDEKVVDTIQEIIDSSHPLTDDQKEILKNIDEFANAKGLEVSQVEFNDDATNGRSGDYIEVTLTNYKLDDAGSFKDDVVIHLDGKIIEIDTGDKSETYNYAELKADFEPLKNDLNEAMRDKYDVQIHNREDNDIIKVSTYEKDEAINQFDNTKDSFTSILSVNDKPVAEHTNDNGYSFISVDSENQVAVEIGEKYNGNQNAEVATGLSSNMGKESGSELKVEQKDNDLEM